MSKKDAREYLQDIIVGQINCRFCVHRFDDGCLDECERVISSPSFECSKDGLKLFRKEFKEELDK